MELFLINNGDYVKEYYKSDLPDHRICLSDEGKKQSIDAGIFLKKYLDNNEISIKNAVIFISPFLRARQTAELINDSLLIDEVREDYALSEQNLGLFGDQSIGRNQMLFQREFNLYNNYLQNGGKFYAKNPQGESPMDVALRTRMFLDMASNLDYHPIFVVSHNTAIKTIVMNIFHYSPDWFNMEEDMKHCSIRHVTYDDDEYIYGGPIKKLKI